LILILEGDRGRDVIVWYITLGKKILGFKIWEQAKSVKLELATQIVGFGSQQVLTILSKLLIESDGY